MSKLEHADCGGCACRACNNKNCKKIHNPCDNCFPHPAVKNCHERTTFIKPQIPGKK